MPQLRPEVERAESISVVRASHSVEFVWHLPFDLRLRDRDEWYVKYGMLYVENSDGGYDEWQPVCDHSDHDFKHPAEPVHTPDLVLGSGDIAAGAGPSAGDIWRPIDAINSTGLSRRSARTC